MSDVVLKVENLYKRYRLGIVNHTALADDLRIAWSKITGQPDPTETYVTANDLVNAKKGEVKAKYVWALQDINLEVKRGEILGIIGKNGAGKSTLLKILSKTTAPTKGNVKIKGRVASLLEVGTGFHPELTGRENIYLNGMILGMKKREIDKKLDEIVDFAGIETYLDTPTKRYSSGMNVRLGFAVAAHLEPDILVVDEVLAVGDAQFQKRAIGKMKEVSSSQGRAVLFVSHNMASVDNLCTKAMLIKEGLISFRGTTQDAIQQYTEMSSSTLISKNTYLNDKKLRRGSGSARYTNVKVLNKKGEECYNFHKRDTIIFSLECMLLESVDRLFTSIAFRTGMSGEIVCSTGKLELKIDTIELKQKIKFNITIKAPPFQIGIYDLYIWLGDEFTSAFDVMDGIVGPLNIKPKQNEESFSFGVFDITENTSLLQH